MAPPQQGGLLRSGLAAVQQISRPGVPRACPLRNKWSLRRARSSFERKCGLPTSIGGGHAWVALRMRGRWREHFVSQGFAADAAGAAAVAAAAADDRFATSLAVLAAGGGGRGIWC